MDANMPKQSLKRQRPEKEVLTEKNFLLEQENLRLQRTIQNLQKEVEFLESLQQKGTKSGAWIDQLLKKTLTSQVFEYNCLERQCGNLIRQAMEASKRHDLLHLTKLNALFILEKIPIFKASRYAFSPIQSKNTKSLKRRAMFQEMLKLCVRQYIVQGGCVTGELDVDDLLRFKPELDLDSSNTTFRLSMVDNVEKWVTIDIMRYAVSKDIMKEALTKIDIFALMTMGSSATKALMIENGQIGKEFNHSIGFTDALLRLDMFPENIAVEEFHLQLKRPSQLKSNNLILMSACDFETNKDEYTMVQSLLPSSDTDLETLEANGAYFTRGVTIETGKPLHGQETCNITILIGLKQPRNGFKFDPGIAETMRQFEKAFELLGGKAFMKPELHAYEKMIEGFSAILKTSVFVYLNYLNR